MSAKTASVLVLYPRKDGAKFNEQYYVDNHMPLVYKNWKAFGFTSYKITKFAPEAPYSYGVAMYFESMEKFQEAMKSEAAKEVLADIPNYSSEQPVIAAGDDIFVS